MCPTADTLRLFNTRLTRTPSWAADPKVTGQGWPEHWLSLVEHLSGPLSLHRLFCRWERELRNLPRHVIRQRPASLFISHSPRRTSAGRGPFAALQFNATWKLIDLKKKKKKKSSQFFSMINNWIHPQVHCGLIIFEKFIIDYSMTIKKISIRLTFSRNATL